ncbi:ABC transporter ATP-binding protein [Lactiplantibacillus mudanjiangensis]|uniref:ABC transporter ATP-binding protein [Lactobacillus sp.] n=1 Tax=Lactiplantibacillus mudanjiangensis TaxID=1296538 RepID=A0A660DW72_9LACO|nr:ATP-binding cassette domain-containing protein [Lactiplantibacillus mudanjiangensis]VDG19016.1 ABC transporter ATP-binding protein [Lactobacillus sp.] [Lactiplantibacillus mudanjiangensis]VDG25506.1 ABC transporter ATP-binding protein [Lactobacillus sp.] [Lactiplantibacillus mudanjiangensis]VDG27535.1 ABC transporter ATP-binding protein [Lactobacillus sp.] [Lactiplantibacillus mudanjiangensis]VDG33110.1 ABC transporter ATP-binding protein [Lactobacillus sp.] [Lactiplantibacillus mudanjiangen
MTKTDTPLISLNHIVTKVNTGTPNEVMILRHLDLDIYDGDFITVLGSNGAGKSTLFNTISGELPVDAGTISLKGQDITTMTVEKRTAFLARVFQDPKMGTAPRMTVAENLLLASQRGKRRTLRLRRLKQQLPHFKALTATMNNGLTERLNTATENLSGGQRQALSFLMATEQHPDLLLLDEHTAALDPKTSAELMHQTNQRVTEENLTCLMITHHLDDALKYGNRLIVLDQGQVKFDVRGAEKAELTKEKLLSFFDIIE